MTTTEARDMVNGWRERVGAEADRVNADLLATLYHDSLLVDWRTATGTAKFLEDELIILEKICSAWIADEEKTETISDLIAGYGSRCEESGFKEGFNFAMNLIMQGMRYPVLPR